MDNKLLLQHLIEFPDLDCVKVKFNQYNGEEDPIDVFLRDPDIINHQWLFWRNKQRYFSVGQIAVCLLKIGTDRWLLTTIKEVEKELNVFNGINYEGKELIQYRPYFGRIILHYHKTHTSQGVYYKNILNQLEVLEITPTVWDGFHFPGYDKIRLTYAQLNGIIHRQTSDWIAALENQKAIYLLVDTSNGKQYVGSATGDNGMLLQRWSSYVVNGHGDNAELKKIVETLGFQHIKDHFQYVLLENYNARVDKEFILRRELWWKSALCSREFGYNSN